MLSLVRWSWPRFFSQGGTKPEWLTHPTPISGDPEWSTHPTSCKVVMTLFPKQGGTKPEETTHMLGVLTESQYM
jgi:hypothetical protein